MRQAAYNRAEEYITLRSEMQLLSSFTRQILYWTVVLVIAGFGWYLTRPINERIPLSIFSLFLYFLIGLSCGAYLIYTNQVYRIGSYIAVFWESRDSGRYMQWHRFNRKGPPGGFLPDSAVFVYAGISGSIVAFLMIFTFIERPPYVVIMVNIGFTLIGVGATLLFPLLRRYLRNQRDRFKREWRIIRASSVRRAEIHDEYETIPFEEVPILRSSL